MATYVIGDVQGCFATLETLLKKINFTPVKDTLIFLGDVINRGPKSLDVLRFLYNNKDSTSMVLGNHEIFALALFLGSIKEHRPHTLQQLFNAPDADVLMEWLRTRPLIIKNDNNIFVHSGILPAVSVDEALIQSAAIEKMLQGTKAAKFLTRFYQKRLANLKLCDTPKKLMRMTLSYLTLMRMCENKYTLDLSYTGSLDKAPWPLKPWFSLREAEPYTIFFGHWAALGFFSYKNYMCLDSGCVWGNRLSAWYLEEQRLIQVENCDVPHKS